MYTQLPLRALLLALTLPACHAKLLAQGLITPAPKPGNLRLRQEYTCEIAGDTICPDGDGCCPFGAACTVYDGQGGCAEECFGTVSCGHLCCDNGMVCSGSGNDAKCAAGPDNPFPVVPSPIVPTLSMPVFTPPSIYTLPSFNPPIATETLPGSLSFSFPSETYNLPTEQSTPSTSSRQHIFTLATTSESNLSPSPSTTTESAPSSADRVRSA